MCEDVGFEGICLKKGKNYSGHGCATMRDRNFGKENPPPKKEPVAFPFSATLRILWGYLQIHQLSDFGLFDQLRAASSSSVRLARGRQISARDFSLSSLIWNRQSSFFPLHDKRAGRPCQDALSGILYYIFETNDVI